IQKLPKKDYSSKPSPEMGVASSSPVQEKNKLYSFCQNPSSIRRYSDSVDRLLSTHSYGILTSPPPNTSLPQDAPMQYHSVPSHHFRGQKHPDQMHIVGKKQERMGTEEAEEGLRESVKDLEDSDESDDALHRCLEEARAFSWTSRREVPVIPDVTAFQKWMSRRGSFHDVYLRVMDIAEDGRPIIGWESSPTKIPDVSRRIYVEAVDFKLLKSEMESHISSPINHSCVLVLFGKRSVNPTQAVAITLIAPDRDSRDKWARFVESYVGSERPLIQFVEDGIH
ncbi:hypothetical protein ADUPG1_010396, partial [Aduncisulcus paluster]